MVVGMKGEAGVQAIVFPLFIYRVSFVGSQQ